MYLSFLAYSFFCFWVIFMEGASLIEGWKSFFLLGWFEATLTADELKFYIGISWLASLVMLLFTVFSGPST